VPRRRGDPTDCGCRPAWQPLYAVRSDGRLDRPCSILFGLATHLGVTRLIRLAAIDSRLRIIASAIRHRRATIMRVGLRGRDGTLVEEGRACGAGNDR
jgi:hypothetical protein